MTLRLITSSIAVAFTLITFTGCETTNTVLECDFQGLSAECEAHKIKNDVTGLKIIAKNETFANSTTKFLTISGFGLSSIPQKIGQKFPNLESFRVRKTSIKLIGNQDFQGMKDLRHVALDSNRISIIYQDALYNLPDLESFYISNNKIEFLHPDLFKNSPKLKSFIADYNHIKILDARLFKNNDKLEWISLIYNRINNIRVDFRELKNLFYVNFSKNVEGCDIILNEESLEHHDRVQKVAEFQQRVEEKCRI